MSQGGEGAPHYSMAGSTGSPGAGYRPPELMPSRLPRSYLVAGTEEPFFLHDANRWARSLRDAGGEVVIQERDADHGSELWRGEFPRMSGGHSVKCSNAPKRLPRAPQRDFYW